MPEGNKPTFAFLLLKEHPYGREMLYQILAEGFVPTIIISEDSEIADEETYPSGTLGQGQASMG